MLCCCIGVLDLCTSVSFTEVGQLKGGACAQAPRALQNVPQPVQPVDLQPLSLMSCLPWWMCCVLECYLCWCSGAVHMPGWQKTVNVRFM